MPSEKGKTDYGLATASGLLIWSAILAYSPAYFGFAEHWSAWILYFLAIFAGFIGFVGSLVEISRLWPDKKMAFNDNLAVALFLAGIAVFFHFLGEWIPWSWVVVVMKLIAVILIFIATMAFAYSTEDAIRATLTKESTTVRRRIWNGVKTLAAFTVGLLSAAVAVLELIQAFSR